MISNERTALINRIETDDRNQFKKHTSLVLILVVQLLERCAFYSIVGNFAIFLTLKPFSWTSYNAVGASFLLLGMAYLSSLIGGWLADSCKFLGKYGVILISYLLYMAGFVFFPILSSQMDKNMGTIKVPDVCYFESSWDQLISKNQTTLPFIPIGDEPCASILFVAITLIGLGSGAFKANISPFGADQVMLRGNEALRVFFNWFYWSVNIGAFLALSVFAYIQQNVDFFKGFLIPMILLGVSFVLFVLGTFCFRYHRNEQSALTGVFKVVGEAIQSKKRATGERQSTVSFDSNVQAEASVETALNTPPSFLDWAKIRWNGSCREDEVEDVKALVKVALVCLTLIPYWLVYFQMETTFLMQALHMKLDIFGESFRVPAAALTLFDNLVLILLIPILDRLVYPGLRRRGISLSIVFRLCLGMTFSAVSMIVAGIVESKRLSVVSSANLTQNISGTTYVAADMTILYQIPQYSLIGFSEAFAGVAGIEFVYVAAPRSMQGLLMGLYWCFSGVGSFLGTALIFAFEGIMQAKTGHFGDVTCDNCHLDYYFYVLAVIQVIGIVIYILVSRRLKLSELENRPKGLRLGDTRNQQQQQQRQQGIETKSSVAARIE